MAKLAGFDDDELHSNIQEALKVLTRAQEAYDHALNGIEGQYLRSLDPGYEDQANAVRDLYGAHNAASLETAPVRPRFS